MTKTEAFHKYLDGVIDDFELIKLIDNIQSKNVKEDGAIYTPKYIVSKMIEMCDITKDTSIIEPSCGHGSFLLGLLNHVSSIHDLKGNDLLNWFKIKVSGVDINSQSVEDLKEILTAYFFKNYKLSIHPSYFNNITVGDGLRIKSNYDLALGNPPYIRTKNIDPQYLKFLRSNFKSCAKGNIDIYYAFVENFVGSCKTTCFIIPNGFLFNKSGTALKNLVIPNTINLINFKDKKIFDDASVYTCVIKTNSDTTSDEIWYSESTDFNGYIKKKIVDFSKKKLNNPFKDVYSGIATLCDKAFKVKKIDDKFFGFYEGQYYEIEKEIVVPFIKITKIKEEILTDDYMIFPYDKNNKILKEETIREKYPLAYKWLLTVKPLLLKRDKGKIFGYDSWYAYGRRQGLKKIGDQEIVAIPVMMGNDCVPISINVSKILDEFDRYVFSSGFIIPKNNKTKDFCEQITSQHFNDYVRKEGKLWPGDYYSISSNHIKNYTF